MVGQAVLDELHLDLGVRQHLSGIVDVQRPKTVLPHDGRAKRIGEPVGVAGVVHMGVHVEVGVGGRAQARFNRAIRPRHGMRQRQRRHEVGVVRDALGHGLRRGHAPRGQIEQYPERAGAAERIAFRIPKDEVTGEKAAAARHGERFDRHALADGRIPVHVQLDAGDDPNDVVRQQAVAAAAEQLGVCARGLLHGLQNGARPPTALHVAVAGAQQQFVTVNFLHRYRLR